jgi:hypothetical protein
MVGTEGERDGGKGGQRDGGRDGGRKGREEERREGGMKGLTLLYRSNKLPNTDELSVHMGSFTVALY